MQESSHLFEIPADKLVFHHHDLQESRNLGQASITTGFRGKARVRIDTEEKTARWPWLLTAIIMLAALGATWQFKVWPFDRPAPPVEPQLITAPTQTTPAAPPVAVAVPPESQPSSGTLILPNQTGPDDANIPGPDNATPAPAPKKPAPPEARAPAHSTAPVAPHKSSPAAAKTGTGTAKPGKPTSQASAAPAKPADPKPAPVTQANPPAHAAEPHKTAGGSAPPAKVSQPDQGTTTPATP